MEYLIVFIMVIESFSGSSSLGGPLWSLRACITSVWALMALSVSIEIWSILLTGLHLYAMWTFLFCLAVFNILFIFLYIYLFLFHSNMFGVLCTSFTFLGISFFKLASSLMILLKTISGPLSWYSSPFSLQGIDHLLFLSHLVVSLKDPFTGVT